MEEKLLPFHIGEAVYIIDDRSPYHSEQGAS